MGENVTFTVHDAPAANDEPQVLVWANCAGALTPEMDAATVPLLVMLTARTALVEPTAWSPNATDVGFAASVAVPAVVPVPVSATVRLGLEALLVTVRLPLFAPVDVGENVTFTVHDAPAASDEPQVLVWANCGRRAHPRDGRRHRAAVGDASPPRAVLVVPTVWFPKATDVGFAASVAVPADVPVPESATVSVGLVAFDDTVRLPLTVPTAVGAKVTLTVHDAPAASDEPQVLVCPYWAEAVMPDSVAAAAPLLVIVTVRAALVVPTVWLPKATDDGDGLRVGLPPPPPEKMRSSET